MKKLTSTGNSVVSRTFTFLFAWNQDTEHAAAVCHRNSYLHYITSEHVTQLCLPNATEKLRGEGTTKPSCVRSASFSSQPITTRNIKMPEQHYSLWIFSALILKVVPAILYFYACLKNSTQTYKAIQLCCLNFLTVFLGLQATTCYDYMTVSKYLLFKVIIYIFFTV